MRTLLKLLGLAFLCATPLFAQNPPLEDQFRTIAWFQPGTTGKSLNVQVTGATVLFNGANVVVPTQVLLLPDNSTTFIDFEGTKNLVLSQTGFGTVNPVYYPIALVITSQGSVSQISDQRPTYTLSSSGGGGGGGGSPAGPPGTVQITNGNQTGFASSAILDNGTIVLISEPLTIGGTLTVNGDSLFKGPNPYIDIRTFSSRAVNLTAAPAIPGITGNCVSTSTSINISAASTFQNGDGFVAFGCGPTHAMTTPVGLAVTPSVAASGTGTGLVVNGPTGGSSYNYQIIAENKSGGMTAASSVATTITGAASLGSQSVNISTFTKSGNTNTVTTATQHGLSVGSMVGIFGTSDDYSFGGWFRVSTVPDNTHFTYINGLSTAGGSPTSATGGTAKWYNCNHLSWTAVAGAFRYYIYGRTGGSLTLLGVNRPSSVDIDTTFDDFGSPMMDNFTAPYYIPNTPPSVATSNHLVTTIVSGAGTTTLTLANAAGTSVSGATVLFDNAPTILAAANSSGMLYIPIVTGGNGFVINSYLTLPVLLKMSSAGSLLLNNTLELGSETGWYGNLTPSRAGQPSFALDNFAGARVGRATPGIYASGGGLTFHGLGFSSSQTNNDLLMVLDQIDGVTFQWVTWDASGAGNTMNIALMIRGAAVNTSRPLQFDHVSMLTNQGADSMTPLFECQYCGITEITDLEMSGRGLHFGSLAPVHIKGGRIQGNSTPFFTYGGGDPQGQGQVGTGPATIEDFEIDTAAQPTADNLFLSSVPVGSLTVIRSGGPSASGSPTRLPNVAGTPTLSLLEQETFNAPSQNINELLISQNQITTNGVLSGVKARAGSTIGYGMATPTAPSVVLGAPGSCVSNCVPAGTYFYSWAAVDVTGNDSLIAPGTSITTDGTKTITVTITPVPGQVLFNPIRDVSAAVGCCAQFNTGPNGAAIPGLQGLAGTSYVDVLSAGYSFSLFNMGFANASSIGPAGESTPSFILTGGGFGVTITGNYTANRTQTISDVSGTIATLVGSFTATHCLQASGSGTTLSVVDSGGTCGGGGGGATTQVNGVNTSNQTTINFQNSAAFNGLTATFTNPSAGNVQLGFSGTLGNAGLTNSSVTVNTSAPLGGGGAVSLGSSLTLTCATCSTAVVNTGTANHIAEYTATGAPATISSDANLDDGATTANTLTYSGAGGVASPSFKATGPGGFTISGVEGSAPAGVGSSDVLWASSVVHRFEMNNNNTGTVVVGANPMTTAGDLTYGGSVVSTVATETRLAAGTATQVLHSGTTPAWGAVVLTTDVSGTLPVANGGCAASTAANCLINIFPTATRAGDIIYWDGSIWNHLAGNNSGTQTLTENASGVPSWAASGANPALSALSSAVATNTLANGNNPQVWNWAQTTASQSAFTFGETTAATGSGDIELNIKTLNTSTAIPWQVTAQGTTVGWNISTAGLLEPLSTGALATGGTAHGFTLSEGSTTAIASLVCGTNTVPLGGGGSADPTCGTVPNAALTNSSVTFNTVAVALGASGNISLDLITNPATSKTFTFPGAGVLTIAGTAPNSSGGAGTNAGTLFGVSAVTGGATTGSGTTAGNGSDFSASTGDGGSGSGGTNANGGRGGNVTFTLGIGGAKSGSGTVGAAGIYTIQSDVTTAVQNSPAVNVVGEYQNSGTPTFATDTWTLQDVVGAGTNGTTTLTISHAGSSGAATVAVPNLTDSALTNGNCVQAGAGGILTTIGGACSAGGSGTVSGGVSGDLGSFTSATAITDSGIVAANVVTQTSNAASGQVCTYTGTNKVCVPATALPNGITATTQSQLDGSTKVSTTLYVDTAVSNAIAGVNPAVAVVAASTGTLTGTYSNGASGIGATFTITATGTFTLDGVTISTIGQRVLLKDQTSGFQNGTYTATVIGTTGVSAVFTRALDYDQPSDINSTGAIPVVSGTANADTSWILTSTVTTVGTDALTYAQFSLAPASIVTAAANFVNGNLIQGAGANKTSSDSGIATANVATAASNASAAKQIWVSGGANKTLTAIDFPETFYIPSANCVNAVAASAWSTSATPASLCRAGTNNKDALLSPWGASDVGYFRLHLPNDWDSGASLDISIDLTSTDATNGHTIIMQASTVCAKGDGSTTDDVAFNAAQSFGTITLNGNANRTWNATLTGLTKTGCIAGSTLWVKISRTTDTATNVGVYGATVDVARLLTVQAN